MSNRFCVNHVHENEAFAADDEPVLQEYHTTSSDSYVRSLRNLTREVSPHIDLYRDAQSVHCASRPTLEELRNGFTLVGAIKRRFSSPSGGSKSEKTTEGHEHPKFGWIQGVLILNIMNLWGPMLFLRTTWLVGQGGLIEAAIVILFSTIITVVTALSTSAIATNGEVKGGGTYYMLSRSLGPEYGGAIGLIFAFANMVGVAMNIVGFCESMNNLLQHFDMKIIDGGVNDIRIVGISLAVLCIIICLVGMEWEQKAQNLLLLILLVSISDVVVGSFLPVSDEYAAKGITGWSMTTLKSNLFPDYRNADFVYIFSVYFTSATGILAGANISGELRDPQKAIPRGTLLAICITSASYLLFAVIAASCVVRDASGKISDVTQFKNSTNCFPGSCKFGLQNSPQILEYVAGYPWLIYSGNFAATISSALACLVGAPRVFQALCRDKIYPFIEWFGKGYGKTDDPIRSYGCTFVIAVSFILIGDLNSIAPIMSNFFMAAFCLINFACFHAALAKSPGFRPAFRFWNMWISFFGALLCLSVMFLMDWKTAIITIIICFLLYLYLYYKKPDVNWGSSAQAETYRKALRAVQELNQTEDHVKNYRPQILVLSGKPTHRPQLVDFAHYITKGISLMSCGHIIDTPVNQKFRNELSREVYAWLLKRKCKAFYSLVEDIHLEHGAKALLQLVGVGKLRPNMLLMGFKSNWRICDTAEVDEYLKVIHDAFDMNLSVGILRMQQGLDYSYFTEDNLDISGFEECNKKFEPASPNMHCFTEIPLQSATEIKAEANIKKEAAKKKKEEAKKEKKRKMSIAKNIPKEIVDKMECFNGKEKRGNIDVWWLYDDGGLTLLIPYILSTRKHWSPCNLRIFSLANKDNQLDEEQRNLAALLSKFRISCTDVTILPTSNSVSEDVAREFNNIISHFKREEDLNEKSPLYISETDLAINEEKTKRLLNIREHILKYSKDSTLIVLTLPMPRRKRIPSALYMSWLEILTKDLPPCLLIRGNQTCVLTFYS